jgi:hypothetical protein
MSRSKEKKEKQQKKQEEKMLERIKSAKVTPIVHEERKKKPALPNRLNIG